MPSCSHHFEHAPGDPIRIFGLGQLGEDILERRFIVKFAETGDGIMGDDAAFAEDKNSVADLLDYFKYMRAVEDHLAAPGEGAKKTAENHRSVHVEARERFVED